VISLKRILFLIIYLNVENNDEVVYKSQTKLTVRKLFMRVFN